MAKEKPIAKTACDKVVTVKEKGSIGRTYYPKYGTTEVFDRGDTYEVRTPDSVSFLPKESTTVTEERWP